MLLGEAILERQFVYDSIDRLFENIRSYIKRRDKISLHDLERELRRFEEVCLQYQQYSIMIDRAKHITKVNIGDNDISLKDAELLKSSIEKKISLLEVIFEDLINSDIEDFDMIGFEKTIYNLKLDVKNLSNKIEGRYWSVEVK
jgi:hypothetical protein